MPSYRIFKLDTDSKRRTPSEWLDAADDDHALSAARQLHTDARCEVWLVDRLVGIVTGDR